MRPLLLVCGLTLVALCIAVALGARTLSSSFAQLENDATAQKAMQIYRAFEADLRQLAISNRDYAEWDDAEQYIHTADPGFIERNFSAITLRSMFVDLVWIVDGQGEEKFSAALDRKAGTITSPAPGEVLQPFQPMLSQPKKLAHLEPGQRVVMTPRGLAAVSAIEISRSNRTNPTGAVMLFARFIRAEDVARVGETSHLTAELTPIDRNTQPSSAVPESVLKWARGPARTDPTFVYSPSSEQTNGYALIRSVNGEPVAVFTTSGTREILVLGHRTTLYMLAAICGLFIAFGVAVAGLMIRLQHIFVARHAVQTLYENIGSQLQEAIAVVGAGSPRIVEANETVLKALGCDRRGVRSHVVQELLPEISTEILQDAANPEKPRKIYTSRLRKPDGSWMDAEVSITAMDHLGRLLLTLVAHDVTHRKEAAAQEQANRKKLLQLAQHDSLTGLPNRLYLRARLPQVLEKIANSERLLALMYVDVDHFKNINDSRGHACGDQLLQIIAKRLRASVSMHDLVARMGGDEFVVVASLMPDRESIDALCSRLQTAVNATIMINEEPLSVGASIGVAVYPDDGLQIDSLLKNADIALYQAKEAGRACHRFFAADMDVRVSEHVALEQALRHACGSHQIFLEYQPVIDMKSGRVASLEALMRWRHPDRGMIPPSRFIPVAEQSGLIIELGQQAVRTVIAQQREWLDMGTPIVPIAVNVSPLQFDRVDFPGLIAQLARERDLDPKWLRFEITESAVMKEPEKLIATLRRLRDLGSHVLIDDFGTGYSSLSYLNRLPIDVLKIDRAFVRDIGQQTDRTPIINAVIDMARKLNLFTIAEGVETAEQAQFLREHGCDYAQGYFYSKPVTASHCAALLAQLENTLPATETSMQVEQSMSSGQSSATG